MPQSKTACDKCTQQTSKIDMHYWPSGGDNDWILADSFFCVFIDQDKVEVHKNTKKRTRLLSCQCDPSVGH